MVINRLFDNLPSNKKNKKFDIDIDIDNLCDPTPHKKTQSLKANYLLSSFLKREISEPTLV
jgi:hypothetical protein